MWEKVVIGSVSTVAGGVVSYIITRRKMVAESEKLQVDALKGALDIWRTTVEDLRQEVENLRASNANMQAELVSLRRDNEKLRNEISRLRCLNNKMLRLLETFSPHNIEEIAREIKKEMENLKPE